jgi:hypothetical protein
MAFFLARPPGHGAATVRFNNLKYTPRKGQCQTILAYKKLTIGIRRLPQGPATLLIYPWPLDCRASEPAIRYSRKPRSI